MRRKKKKRNHRKQVHACQAFAGKKLLQPRNLQYVFWTLNEKKKVGESEWEQHSGDWKEETEKQRIEDEESSRWRKPFNLWKIQLPVRENGEIPGRWGTGTGKERNSCGIPTAGNVLLLVIGNFSGRSPKEESRLEISDLTWKRALYLLFNTYAF